MQSDLFKSKARIYLESLQDRKAQLREELEGLNNELIRTSREGRSLHIGGKAWLQKHDSGELILFSPKPQLAVFGPEAKQEIDFFSVVSVDLLRKAMKN